MCEYDTSENTTQAAEDMLDFLQSKEKVKHVKEFVEGSYQITLHEDNQMLHFDDCPVKPIAVRPDDERTLTVCAY